MDQELIFRASMLEKQSQEIQGNLELISNRVQELENFHLGLKKFSKVKEKEVISQLGNGFYIKSELSDPDVFVDIGSGIIVKKSPEESQEIVEVQIKTLAETKIKLAEQLDAYNRELVDIMNDLRKEIKPESS